MAPSLEEAAAELYAVEPGRFTTERSRLTGEARQAKDPQTARAIGELRRPTTSAWLINQLARGQQALGRQAPGEQAPREQATGEQATGEQATGEQATGEQATGEQGRRKQTPRDRGAGEEMKRLEQLGQELREAQAALDANLMRELTKERQRLVAALVRQADEIAAEAGQKVSAAVRRELEDTLGAAVADEQASLAVMSGRLTRALTFAGFGEVDVTEATATPLKAGKPARADSRGGPGSGSGDLGGSARSAKTSPMKREDSKLAPARSQKHGESPGTAPHRKTFSSSRPASHPEDLRQDEDHQPSGTEPSAGEHRPTEKQRSAPQPTAENSAEQKEQGTAKKPAQEVKAEKQAARRREAEELLTQSRADFDTAEEALRQKELELDEATTEQTELQARLNELQAEIVSLRRKLDAGDRRVSRAERDVTRQQRHLKEVTKSLDRAEAALDRLEP
ncbi:hypothetical protein [Kineosporia babensis]|uniref:Uncharacterized protein n=1 Tax=Kineosporia babensis TaxID=499548 RepID=A0A9X1NFX0_9ACTN|nr:hypothetical protein [Kineosporia babensis]MCD5313388.1 hypothetical protein [Kineosporia babensis]